MGHLLHEVRAYNLLLRDTGTASRFAQVDDSAPEAVAMAEIRASGRYRLPRHRGYEGMNRPRHALGLASPVSRRGRASAGASPTCLD